MTVVTSQVESLLNSFWQVWEVPPYSFTRELKHVGPLSEEALSFSLNWTETDCFYGLNRAELVPVILTWTAEVVKAGDNIFKSGILKAGGQVLRAGNDCVKCHLCICSPIPFFNVLMQGLRTHQLAFTLLEEKCFLKMLWHGYSMCFSCLQCP